MQSLRINRLRSEYVNSVVTYRKIKLLLWIGITTTVVALITSIYGLLQIRYFAPNDSKVSIHATKPVFYKSLAEVPNVAEGLFNYGGSTTFAPLRSKAVVSKIHQAHPQFQLVYTEPIGSKPGSSAGINMLLEGELSFAQSSRPLENSEFSEAKKRGFTLEQVAIAIDGITVYVNPQVSIPGLTVTQLRDIYIGKIKNWKAVGGSDLPIIPFSRNAEASGTVDFFKEKVLAGEEFATNVKEVKTTTESLRKVANTPGGIGYATASEVVGQSTVRPLPLSRKADQPFVPFFTDANATILNKTAFASGSYPLTRRLFVIIKQDGRLDEQGGVAYVNLLLSDEGQQLLEQAGFVPIR